MYQKDLEVIKMKEMSMLSNNSNIQLSDNPPPLSMQSKIDSLLHNGSNGYSMLNNSTNVSPNNHNLHKKGGAMISKPIKGGQKHMGSTMAQKMHQ